MKFNNKMKEYEYEEFKRWFDEDWLNIETMIEIADKHELENVAFAAWKAGIDSGFTQATTLMEGYDMIENLETLD